METMKPASESTTFDSTSQRRETKPVTLSDPRFDKRKIELIDRLIENQPMHTLELTSQYKDLLFRSQAFFYLEIKETTPGDKEINRTYNNLDVLYRFFCELEQLAMSAMSK